MKDYGTGTTVFDLVFPNLTMGENTVSCPFHSEKTPSLQINTLQKIYHCFGCNSGGSENDFLSQYYKIGREQTSAFKEVLFKSDRLEDFENFARVDEEYKTNYTYLELLKLGISERTLEELKVGSEVTAIFNDVLGYPEITVVKDSTRLIFPIIFKDRVLDLRGYTADKSVNPKAMSKSGAPAGLVLPHHLWFNDGRPTIVCEGEKDMAMLREKGYNSISLGGCNNIPTNMLEQFKDRTVYIVYDNDLPGKAGATKLASSLFSVTKHIYIADISKYVTEEKEDVTDFFVKYKYKNEVFDELLEKAVIFDTSSNDDYIKLSYPEVSLNEASTSYLGKTVRSNIQVMATYEDQYSVPGYAVLTKENSGGKEEINKKRKGDVEYWSLQKNNFDDVLILTDNNLKKSQICDNIKSIVGWGSEEYVNVKTSNPKTIFKACVADCTESIIAKDVKRTEFVCYTNERLDAGKNYQIIYRVVPHPYKGQQQVLIVIEVKESGDVITTFEVTSDTINTLKDFQKHGFKELVNMQKSYVQFDVDSKLLAFIDLWYHTPKEFSFGRIKEIRGFLDGMIITESRVGKSSTAQALSKAYGVGAIASLAGSAATPAGLIGGSVKTGTSSQIRPGLIPRNHNKSVIFEELAKAKYSLMPELTDIRSSGLVRINRSTGDLTLPASVRMLFLTNPKSEKEGNIRPIMAFPNGVEIIKPLIGSVEDIARFDFIYILGETPGVINPLWEPPEGFTEKQLKTRLHWVWSRKSDNIKLSKDVQKYIVEMSQKLNELYGGSVRIFSTETWKKISRLAIAVAGYMVSTDITFEDILVEERHVNIACTLMKQIYDNGIFKLKEYVDEERKQVCFTVADLHKVKELSVRFPSMLTYLENNNNVAKSTLFTVSGLDQLVFNEAVQRLSKEHFIVITDNKIYPTSKFLVAVKKAKDSVTEKEED